MYVDTDYYDTVFLGEQEIDNLLLDKASRQIDTLTFNRIRGVGFYNLTPFQQEVIKECVCRQVDFLVEYADILDTVVTSYSINGVSMNFGDSMNVVTQSGVAMKRDTYELLKQTGLTRQVV